MTGQLKFTSLWVSYLFSCTLTMCQHQQLIILATNSCSEPLPLAMKRQKSIRSYFSKKRKEKKKGWQQY